MRDGCRGKSILGKTVFHVVSARQSMQLRSVPIKHMAASVEAWYMIASNIRF